jgi:hypothetical protein
MGRCWLHRETDEGSTVHSIMLSHTHIFLHIRSGSGIPSNATLFWIFYISIILVHATGCKQPTLRFLHIILNITASFDFWKEWRISPFFTLFLGVNGLQWL